MIAHLLDDADTGELKLFSREHCEYWDKIKRLSWDRFPNRRYFINDKDGVMIIRDKHEVHVVVGFSYLCYLYKILSNDTTDNIAVFNSSLFALASSIDRPSRVVHIGNYDFNKLRPYTLSKFNANADYYRIYGGRSDVLTRLNLEGALRATKSKKPRANSAPTSNTIDWEAATMNALRSGNGDLLGF